MAYALQERCSTAEL